MQPVVMILKSIELGERVYGKSPDAAKFKGEYDESGFL